MFSERDESIERIKKMYVIVVVLKLMDKFANYKRIPCGSDAALQI